VFARIRAQQRGDRLEAPANPVGSDLLLAGGELMQAGGDPLQHLQELADLAIPEHADLCVADLVGPDGAIRAGAVSASDPDAATSLAQLRKRESLQLAGPHPVAVVIRTGQPQLLQRMSDTQLATFATDPDHLALMTRLRYRSAVVVPLTARGSTIGALSFLRFGAAPAYGPDDLALFAELARRAGLAIDHARLFGRLTDTESELRAVLESLAEAVTVQDQSANIVYANRAAAELMGYSDEAGLIADGGARAVADYGLKTEDGREVDLEMLPARRVLAGAPAEELTVQMIHRETGETIWRSIKATPILDASGHPRAAVNVIEDVTATKRAEKDQRFLSAASKLLSSSLDIKVTLEKVAWAAVPELADWCAVDIPDARGSLGRVATADIDPQRRSLSALVIKARSADQSVQVGGPQVMRTGRPEFYPVVDEALLQAAAADEEQLAALREVRARSVLVVPLLASDRVIGTITMGTADSNRRLTMADVLVAEELGRRAGTAIDNARVHGERTQIAATLQEALLPPRLPVIAGLSTAARFRAAGEGTKVGGDFYDLFAIDGVWMVIMGDVTGKGPGAAAITALARYTMRTAAMYEPEPSRVLARLDQALGEEGNGEQLCTAVCARIELAGGRAVITVACGGHPSPLLIATDGSVTATGASGTLLGASDLGAWSDTRVELDRGEALVFYTDGVTDTRGRDERFGSERLEKLLGSFAGRSAEEIATGLEEALLAFQDGPQRDDVAIVVLEASGEGKSGSGDRGALAVASRLNRGSGLQATGGSRSEQQRGPRGGGQEDVHPNDLGRQPQLVLHATHDSLSGDQTAGHGHRAAHALIRAAPAQHEPQHDGADAKHGRHAPVPVDDGDHRVAAPEAQPRHQLAGARRPRVRPRSGGSGAGEDHEPRPHGQRAHGPDEQPI